MNRFAIGSAAASLLAATLLSAGLSATAAAATLDDVKARGKLVCGVNQGLPGFGAEAPDGKWTGFDVDFCRAVAAAIFADPDKVEYVPLSASERFKALSDGNIDLLARNSTWTMGRETELGLTFVGVTYYDGQGFLLPRSAGVLSSFELDGSRVCVIGGTTSEANLADYFNANNMSYEAVLTDSPEATLAAYKKGDCNVITSDMSQLYAERLELDDADEHLVLADAISKEPLGPVVRQDDPKWATLVRWVYFALLDAEELGIASDTIDEALASAKPDVRRLVGTEGNFGEQMGLSNSWAADTVRLVGNYAEIYERNLGTGSPLGIPRGMNQLWNRGGLQYPPPIR
ncbi:MAG: amino acid ABC transporter substrate-binding protein [Bauldia sp.]|nr:amino acid ABC transporter substrate-binding protein [Bauldia sp.]